MNKIPVTLKLNLQLELRKNGIMSTYTIKDAAKLMNVPPSTIRYYDKEGLIPFIERKESGYRIFTEEAIATLKIIDCLKKTGMSIKDIRQFCQWVVSCR